MYKEIMETNIEASLPQDSLTRKGIGQRFLLVFDDADIAPIVFTGDGAEDAALQAYRSKLATLSCHLFAEIGLSDANVAAAQSMSDHAAMITVHQHRQVRVEILDSEQSVEELQAFDRMAEARSWLSARGFQEDQITIRVEQTCERPADGSGYAGIFYCANCQHSCVESEPEEL